MRDDVRFSLGPSCHVERNHGRPKSEQPVDESVRSVGVGGAEAFGHQRVKRAYARLSALEQPGDYEFHLNTASYPLPFCPERIKVTREELKHSNFNGLRLGSVFNNWTLSTIFLREERNLISVDDLRTKYLKMSQVEFMRLQRLYFEKNSITGDAEDLTTWSRANWHGKDFRVHEDYRLRGLFRAASKPSTFVVLKDTEIVEIRPLNVASVVELQGALNKIFVAMRMSRKVERGLAVPALGRAAAIWAWLIGVLGLVTFGAWIGWSGLELWEMDYFEAVVFACLSVPALVEYISEEPSVVRNAIRGNRVLWKNSQVRGYFRLDKFDYAVMALINDPMWLVSDDKACFTQQGGHSGMVGDEPVTDTWSLREVGFYVGRVMARKEWEDFNMKVHNRSDGSVFIDRNSQSGAKRISGEGLNRPVG